MKSVKTKSKLNFLSLRVLLLIYVLICVLTILFSRTFINDLLKNSKVIPLFQMVLYFTIPAVLFVFLSVSVFNFLADLLKNKTGSLFQARLIFNFIIVVVLAAAPVFLVTIQSIRELTRFWPEMKLQKALSDAKNLSVEVFSLKTEKFENYIKTTNIDKLIADDSLFMSANGISALQDFSFSAVSSGDPIMSNKYDALYTEKNFYGDEKYRLTNLSAYNPGFSVRELPRDTDVVRYVDTKNAGVLRVFTFSLGAGFDQSMQQIDLEATRIDILNNVIILHKVQFILFYMFVFLLPTILITIIISINFTHDITQPVVDLSEATMQVAKGDFTIQILNNPKNELGSLIGNFNVMVQNLEKTQNALLRTEKISIWQTMAQQLAHEIKNPLTPIKLTAQRVLRRYKNDPQSALDILDNSMMAVIQEVDSLTALLEEFRTLSRPIEPSVASTNIKEAIEEIITPYITGCPNIDFDTKSMYSRINVLIDRKHLTQIINNLVINAIDAMDGEGKIDIRTDIVYKRQAGFCRLTIADTGKGISKEDEEKVWTPYFTTKDSGTGLGLAIVERIINEHGGGIWFNSSPGEGTTFFVDIPVEA
ncbi:MAG: ATP-binding protein [Termitinemataceae bacterium]|nr:MAG: ATP-binding protein [Termitinemataceae bacterium]